MDEQYKEELGKHVDLTDSNQIAHYLNEETLSFLSQLDSIWDETGIDDDDRKQRGYRVIEHVQILLNDMLKEAVDFKNRFTENITLLLEELSDLGKELRVDISVDITGYENMPLITVINKLQQNIKKYRNMHVSIMNEVKSLNETGKTLFLKLGKKEKYLPVSPVPVRAEIDTFKSYIEDLSVEVRTRQDIFIRTKEDITRLMKEINSKATLDFEKMVLRETEQTFLVSDENMQRLQNWLTSLKTQQQDIQQKVADLREKIGMFWERLEKPPEERSAFLDAYPGSSMSSYQALKEEELRCKEEIKTNIKLIVDKMRREIEEWWDKCSYGNKQKQEFIHFNTDCYTEDLLTLHEIYVDKLKNYFINNKAIFDLVHQRSELWKRLLELENKAVNPDRLKNRGGQLLREEKERNSVRARLPKVEKKLETLIEQYETGTGKIFSIFDQKMSDIITNDWEEFKENRNFKLSAKKQARELKTPSKSRVLLNVNTPATPKSTKHKLATALFEGSSKKTRSVNKKLTPKIQINASIINKRVSLERRKRLEPKRHSFGKNKSITKSSTATDYRNFKRGLEIQACRSTLQIPDPISPGPSRTPRRPQLIRTPSNIRSKSPISGVNHLTPAVGDLPIII